MESAAIKQKTAALAAAADQGTMTASNLLSRVLISALCPFLKSEIALSEPEKSHSENFKYWIGQEMGGDLAGSIGLGCEHHTLLSLALKLKLRSAEGKADVSHVLHVLHELISGAFQKQLAREDFPCEFLKKPEILRDFQFSPPSEPFVLTSVETKFGIIKVLFRLSEDSSRFIEEECGPGPMSKDRKIRVFAHQLDRVFVHAQSLEALEAKIFTHPNARLEVRSEIKRLKRLIRHLKSEPLDTLFAPARRLALEISKQEGKQVRLSTHGAALQMDKSLLNYLYEPVLHVIRNAVDHGIETPEDRERVGKPSMGYIKCIASFGASALRIIISDDGRGLDLAKIRERAIAKGFLDRASANTRVASEIYPLIFEAGFSTRESANAISGRGLGLDIVKRGVESLDGTIRILSSSHRGTSFEITIPINDDLTSIKAIPTGVASTEEEEKLVLLEELSSYFEKLFRVAELLQSEKAEKACYEAYRLLHSIKGVVAFLGWNRVAIFCHRLEEILKALSEKKLGLLPEIKTTLVEGIRHLHEFCEASQAGLAYSLFEIRRVEGHVQHWIWSTEPVDDRSLALDRIHLTSIQKILEGPFGADKLKVGKSSDSNDAMKQPFGALVQFSGDRRGYAGIVLPENTLYRITEPLLTGSQKSHSLESHFWALGELSCLMGAQIAELSQKEKVWLQASSPLTYYGKGQPLKILGTPTYCYSCELGGLPFYLVGDFRNRKEEFQVSSGYQTGSYHPSLILQEAQVQCVKYFSNWNLNINFNEFPSQSDLVGFDTGLTAIITCKGNPSSILFMSYDRQLAKYIYQQFMGTEMTETTSDFYDCINETSNIVGGLLMTELEKRRISLELSLPSIFVGKAYVANFNRLYVTNRLLANTGRGRFELQVLVTHVPG